MLWVMAYGANLPDLFRRAATQVVKILRGAKSADLPVEQPTKFEFVVNLKTAKSLGLPSVLAQAGRSDRVMDRRAFVAGTFALLAALLANEAQPARVGHPRDGKAGYWTRLIGLKT
jgi:hypothetical protein